ncbi:MAG TPA: tetratricopeptide repeat protein [Thermoanaerobaculia bacterium]|nr:tetratricopeptide repeat protein [Thermoanaerobaculia bacterium]
MSQHSSDSPTSFTVPCPGCGQRLRFSLGAGMPPRLRLQCASCKTLFGVRRPGAGPADPSSSMASIGTSPPTLIAFPTAGTPGAGEAGSHSVTSPPSASSAAARPRGADEPGFAADEIVAGRYRVVRFIARGGMGEVFEVEDLELKERVALKTVRGDVARDVTAIERFRREIQLARKVTHPNVCRIFDVSHHREEGAAETIFLTMELLPGETLSQRLRRAGPMLPGEALPIARQIAEALHAAHQVGVVHRDLKPGNVVLTETRGSGSGVRGIRAVVTDFGLARLDAGADAEGQALTITGAAGIVGTPAYLAPEQVEGGEITVAVDVFAFGIVLYEMLTGTVPFLGDNALATAVKRLRETPVSPRVHSPGIEPRWETAILRCLERDPAARFRSAPEVIRALERPATQETVLTRRQPAPPIPPLSPPGSSSGSAKPSPGPPRRRRLQIAAFAALALVALAVGWLRYGQWREKQAALGQHLPLPATDITPRRSVAVLGFKDLSGQPGTAWLSSALSEMFSTELGAGGGLRVVSGENVARAKVDLGLGTADTLARDTLARVRTLLGSDAVLLGSYVAVDGAGGRQIRLDVRLQDTQAGETTTTVTETGSERQLFDLVAKVGKRLRRQLGVEDEGGADAGDARAALPASPEAARLYSEGIERLRLFDPVGARDLLVRAVVAEPANALSHSALATAWNALGYDAKAREEAKAAFDRAANLPWEERLLIEGRYREVTQDWDHAIQTWWKLWSKYPDNLDYGLRLAAVQTDSGRVADALATTAALRTLPGLSRDDPRIDMAEAMAAGAGADFKRQQAAASRAAARGTAEGAPLMVAQARLLECRALRNLGQPEAALAACEAGRKLHEQAGDRAGVAEALTHAANVLYDRGDLPGADRLYEQALATYREIGNRGAEAGALNIAVVLKSQGDLDHARGLYEQVLAISREIGSRGGEAYSLNNLAGVLLRRGGLDEAAKLFEQSLAIRREQQDRGGIAYALDNLGVVLRRKGDLAAARKRHEEALGIRQEIGQKIGEVASRNNLGTVLLDQGELAAARASFEAALTLARQTGNKSASAYSLFGLGEVLAREGNVAEARKRHEEALALRTQLGEKGTSAESQLALANVLLDAGDAAGAAGLASAAAAELGHQGAASDQARALAALALAEDARSNAAAARDSLSRATALIQGNQDLQSRLTVELAAARLGRSEEPAIRSLADQASRAGLLDLRLQADLALAQRAAQGKPGDGGAKLAALQKEAQGLGYGAIARKARGG